MKIRNIDLEKDLPKILKIQDIEKAKEILRQKRDEICYPIINRGDLWYRRLSEQQKIELDIWYVGWLDVTKTFIIPTKPTWLK